MPRSDPPAWVRAGSLVLCLAGLAISAYLTVQHYSASLLLACPDTGAVNCVKVTTSSYSLVLGVPVAVLGLAYFVVMTGWCSPPVWRAPHAAVRRGRLAAAGVGVVSVFYLVWAELFGVQALCLWCTAVHAVTIALFAVIAVGTALSVGSGPGSADLVDVPS
jgi:uncharacterized membrane protein